MSGGLLIVDRFLFETLAHRLRHGFDRFEAAAKRLPVWAVEAGTDDGFFLRARPQAVLSAEDVRQFAEALREWSIERLGLARVSWPKLDLHAGGARTPVRAVEPRGRLVYQYFLTRGSRRTAGGSTALGNGIETIEPSFNRLAVFDSRAAHGVTPVEGPSAPVEARLALTGTIREGGPLLSGGLALDQVWPGLEPVLRRFFAENQSVVRTHDGLLVIRCLIRPDGQVAEWGVKLDRVIAPTGENGAWKEALAGLEAGFRTAVFPGAAEATELVLPLSFGLVPAEDEDEESVPTPSRSDGERAILSRIVETRPRDARLLSSIVNAALRTGDLDIAADFAARHALLTRGSDRVRGEPTPLALDQGHYLTVPKIAHDIEQFSHLRRLGRVGPDFDEVLEAYRRALEARADRDPSARIPVAEIGEELVRKVDGRILHLRDTPRVPGTALSGSWDRRAVEDGYLDHSLGIMVIDDFLSAPAWSELLQFCQDSTIWFANRYGNGRLGAFFGEGFNCPLLVQIAEEIRDAFPRVIGRKHPLAQMWGYKYSPVHVSRAPHADFAAVNVNFWITPDEANLDPEHGGLVIYDREAPPDWEFDDYNKNRGRKITNFISETGAKSIEIPYRANRAVIFNSDLFHATAECRFGERYEDRRMNVTMLYGRRGEA
ncbi:MAG TPA: hypothetical protein VKP60_02215 [Magnetospirillaceae bacterium]|nr:hypothetical protein [Magnetospirillaceae bacterium]